MDAVIMRTTVALGVVLLVMWISARLLRRSATGRGTDIVELVGRQALSKAASIAVVRVGERAYVLGVTDARVELVAELAIDVVRPPAKNPVREQRQAVMPLVHPVPSPAQAAPVALPVGRDIVPERRPGGVLAGSALSPTTWKSGFSELRERSVRRP